MVSCITVIIVELLYVMKGSISTDIDECTNGMNKCEQQCHNTVGSYQCSCDSGYRLKKDGLTCEGKTNNTWNNCMVYIHVIHFTLCEIIDRFVIATF